MAAEYLLTVGLLVTASLWFKSISLFDKGIPTLNEWLSSLCLFMLFLTSVALIE